VHAFCYIFGLASALASTSSLLPSASRPKITVSASALAWLMWPLPWPRVLTASLTSVEEEREGRTENRGGIEGEKRKEIEVMSRLFSEPTWQQMCMRDA